MAAWAGLGYYARARNLHACARIVAGTGMPADPDALTGLPGIGRYTATAIAAIAFGVPGVPVDGNVERVVARVFAVTETLPGAKPALRDAAERLGGAPEARERPSDFAQALFDLGATVCTPASPGCVVCPWVRACEGVRRGIAAELPRRAPARERPVRYGVHFWLQDEAGRVLLRRRAASGLLGRHAGVAGHRLARRTMGGRCDGGRAGDCFLAAYGRGAARVHAFRAADSALRGVRAPH